jgi:hypothetical protein
MEGDLSGQMEVLEGYERDVLMLDMRVSCSRMGSLRGPTFPPVLIGFSSKRMSRRRLAVMSKPLGLPGSVLLLAERQRAYEMPDATRKRALKWSK